MIELHPEILRRDGKNQFVVLPYEEFLAVKELLEDLEDLRELRAAKDAEGSIRAITLDDARRELDLA
ncbi:MAG: type II toxin-antitoxin system Phd/YefM family antitoxin [Deferrisomatales bacterium]